MKLWIEKRNDFNRVSKNFEEWYYIHLKEDDGQTSIPFITDSADDAEFMFYKIAQGVKPSKRVIIKEIEL